jgi:hypothetical protein
MSHIVRIETKVRDPAAVAAACQRLGLPAPVQGTARLYSGEATGLLVQLPGWQYPVVINTTTGEARYDNYGGAWGDPGELERLLQRYAVEKCRLEARKKGHSISEQDLPNGAIRLQIVEGT